MQISLQKHNKQRVLSAAEFTIQLQLKSVQHTWGWTQRCSENDFKFPGLPSTCPKSPAAWDPGSRVRWECVHDGRAETDRRKISAGTHIHRYSERLPSGKQRATEQEETKVKQRGGKQNCAFHVGLVLFSPSQAFSGLGPFKTHRSLFLSH